MGWGLHPMFESWPMKIGCVSLKVLILVKKLLAKGTRILQCLGAFNYEI